jgi:hypothetical protein
LRLSQRVGVYRGTDVGSTNILRNLSRRTEKKIAARTGAAIFTLRTKLSIGNMPMESESSRSYLLGR